MRLKKLFKTLVRKKIKYEKLRNKKNKKVSCKDKKKFKKHKKLLIIIKNKYYILL
jgi:hypothetical protein